MAKTVSSLTAAFQESRRNGSAGRTGQCQDKLPRRDQATLSAEIAQILAKPSCDRSPIFGCSPPVRSHNPLAKEFAHLTFQPQAAVKQFEQTCGAAFHSEHELRAVSTSPASALSTA
eukprot:jgi/Astpho2/2195/Aster-03185